MRSYPRRSIDTVSAWFIGFTALWWAIYFGEKWSTVVGAFEPIVFFVAMMLLFVLWGMRLNNWLARR